MLLLNYKPVLHQPTGIGVYANAVLPALQNFNHAFIPGGGSGGGTERLRRLAWSQFQLPKLAKELSADLLFTPAPEGYLGEQTVPQVVMVHDLRPLIHPECSLQSLYFRNWVPSLLRQSRHILTNSMSTALAIRLTTGLAEEKISVTPLGYSSDHFYASKVERRLHDRPYLLHIGQAYPHKNLIRVIQAFSQIIHAYPEVDLVLAGKPHKVHSSALKRLVFEKGLTRRVTFIDYVEYNLLPDLYKGALALVYPSYCEGFGLPILEAMACGIPVITSYGSATEEVSGDSALLVDPYSTTEICHAMRALLSSKSLRDDLSHRGILHSRSYSWNSCRAATSKIFKEIMASI